MPGEAQGRDHQGSVVGLGIGKLLAVKGGEAVERLLWPHGAGAGRQGGGIQAAAEVDGRGPLGEAIAHRLVQVMLKLRQAISRVAVGAQGWHRQGPIAALLATLRLGLEPMPSR